MALNSNPHPPKRRRTDLPPSNQTIAQSNAALHVFAPRRQSRWMQGFVPEDETQTRTVASPAVNQNANGDARRSNSRGSSHDPNMFIVRAQPLPSISLAASPVQQQGQLSDKQAMPPVAHETSQSAETETPLGLPTPAVNGPAANGQKSLEASTKSSLPGLPSPAPSDENTNSPTFAVIRVPPPQRARSSLPTRLSGETMLATVPPPVPSASQVDPAVPPGGLPQHFAQISHHPALQQGTQHGSATVGLFQQRDGPQIAPSQQLNQHRRPTPNNVRPASPIAVPNAQANEQPLPVPPILSSHHASPQPPLQQAPLPVSRYPNETLLKNLDNTEMRIRTAATLSPTDRVRLMLFRDAVRRSDLFYQVASQLFCLQTASPNLLPQCVRNLNNKSYDYLVTLLGSNTEVNPELLRVFANIPKRLTAISSGEAKPWEGFEMQVQSVKTFLEMLPAHWEGLVKKCKKIPSPPLVQDLVERLHLNSFVLQTTAFLTIARMLFGFVQPDGRGMAALEKIHKIDQDTYFRLQYTRNDAEKREAYLKLRGAFEYCRVDSQRFVNNQAPQGELVPPQHILAFFQTPPKSTTRNSQAAQRQHLQQQQRQHLQQQQRQHLQQQQRQQQHAARFPHQGQQYLQQGQQYPQQGQQYLQQGQQYPQQGQQYLQQGQQYLQQGQQYLQQGQQYLQQGQQYLQQGQQYPQQPDQLLPLGHSLLAQASTSGNRGSQAPTHPQQIDVQQHQFRTVSTSGTPQAIQQNRHVTGLYQPTADPPRFYPLLSQTPRPQQTQPTPAISALHQAHLRSPVLGPALAVKDSPRLYRHVIGFALPPTKLKRTVVSQTISLRISPQTMARAAETLPPREIGEPHRQTVLEDSLMFRLRCSLLPPSGFTTENAWVTADNYWPESLYFEFNETKVETRRKLHYGRFLPVDITAYVKEGVNELRVFRDQQQQITTARDYVVAIETIGVKSHQNIIDSITRIPADESLYTIKMSLAGADTRPGDDEIAVTSRSMTIKLFDPYSGCKMFDLPVRGTKCLHKDCFDLETFLSMCKRERAGWPTVVDCWRCPLCRGDVRPQNLVLDEYLLKIRQDLASRNLLDTRAIVINADGSWKPKLEERTGVRSPSMEREKERDRSAVATHHPTSASAAPERPVEIIELE